MEPPTNPTNQNPQQSPPQPLVEPPAVQAPAVYPSAGANTPQTYNQPSTLPPVAVNSPGLIVLQWLTYAFWGWTILAMSALTISVLANFITGAETGGFTPYGIAAVLVLLPISIVCDVFYSKQEPQKKAGAASIVMVIHAVIFALFGIGAVIAIVFSLVSMLTSSSDSSGTSVSLFSAMIITVLYAAVFLRTINPQRLPMVRRFFIIFMTAVVGIIAILGIVGPVAHERATRNDRLISGNLSTLKSQIDDYARDKDRLPDSLRDLDLNGDTKVLVDKNLVKYTPNTQSSSTTSPSNTRNSIAKSTTYYYQLCVTYTKATKKDRYGSSYSSNKEDSSGYSTYLNTYNSHPAGEECYKLKTNSYDY